MEEDTTPDVKAHVQWELYELFQAFLEAPSYHLLLEALLMLWVLWLLLRKSYNPQDKSVLTEKEKEELIAEWVPEPLVPDVDENHPALHVNIVSGRPGKFVRVNDIECLNMATHNYLGMIDNTKVEDAAIKSLRKYGVGSCGPRGFYGTVDVHLELEKRLAKFMEVEEAILYSYGFATIASAIPAYSKRGDVIFADEGVSFAIQKGLMASRSDLKFFRHNDVEDLERLLKIQEEEDMQNRKKARVTRRFLVVEGVYLNYGDICPLPQIVELKNKFKVRLFVEESISFGVLGKQGRGVCEHFNISTDEVDLIAASLEYSIGSNGGFCCGTSYVVDHQHLSGLGYCFSASLPPMLASAAIAALDILEEDTSIVSNLQNNARLLQEALAAIQYLSVVGDPISPVKHVSLAEPPESRSEHISQLEAIVDHALKHGVALTLARYLEHEEHKLPTPSIRIVVNSLLSPNEIQRVAHVLSEASATVLT